MLYRYPDAKTLRLSELREYYNITSTQHQVGEKFSD